MKDTDGFRVGLDVGIEEILGEEEGSSVEEDGCADRVGSVDTDGTKLGLSDG